MTILLIKMVSDDIITDKGVSNDNITYKMGK